MTTNAPARKLPAFAAEIVRGRRQGARPKCYAELAGGKRACAGGLDYQPLVYVTDSWLLAKHWRAKGAAAVVIEAGVAYDFTWARGWLVRVLTRADHGAGLRDYIKRQGADYVIALVDPDWVLELEARAQIACCVPRCRPPGRAWLSSGGWLRRSRGRQLQRY